MKETTMITGLVIISATVLAAMGTITGDNWAFATGIAGAAKGIQGASDRWGAKGGK